MAINIESRGSGPAAKASGASNESLFRQMESFFSRIGRQIKPWEVLFLASQLSLMLEIGTSLNVALKAIGDQSENPAFKELLQAMIQDVEGGGQLSHAMRQHPRVFNNMFVSMVKAGETGGFLKKILDRIVDMQERSQALKAQIKSALIYPAILCGLAILVIIFILVGVLPKFATFFQGKESILPFTTRFLMIMSDSLKGYWWAYIISGMGLVIGLKLFKESETGQALIDWMSVNGPVIGQLSRKVNTCQLLRTLGNLMESSVPLPEALEVTNDTIKNRYFKHFLDKIMNHVKDGGRFSDPFASYPYTMESVKQMVVTGEESGNLPAVMLRLAEFYDGEVDRELKSFASIIEPMALVVLGGVIGLIVSSVIIPIFRMAGGVH